MHNLAGNVQEAAESRTEATGPRGLGGRPATPYSATAWPESRSGGADRTGTDGLSAPATIPAQPARAEPEPGRPGPAHQPPLPGPAARPASAAGTRSARRAGPGRRAAGR